MMATWGHCLPLDLLFCNGPGIIGSCNFWLAVWVSRFVELFKLCPTCVLPFPIKPGLELAEPITGNWELGGKIGFGEHGNPFGENPIIWFRFWPIGGLPRSPLCCKDIKLGLWRAPNKLSCCPGNWGIIPCCKSAPIRLFCNPCISCCWVSKVLKSAFWLLKPPIAPPIAGVNIWGLLKPNWLGRTLEELGNCERFKRDYWSKTQMLGKKGNKKYIDKYIRVTWLGEGLFPRCTWFWFGKGGRKGSIVLVNSSIVTKKPFLRKAAKRDGAREEGLQNLYRV